MRAGHLCVHPSDRSDRRRRAVTRAVFFPRGAVPATPARAASQGRAPAERWRYVIDAQHVTPAALPLEEPSCRGRGLHL